MSNLGTMFPPPVAIKVGGRRFKAMEFRLRHLARLDAAIARRAPDPWSMLDADPLDRDAYRQALRDAYTAAEDGPPAFGTAEGNRILFGSPGGIAVFLKLTFRRDPRFKAALAAGELAPITPAEWARVERVALAADPLAEVVRRIDAEVGGPDLGHYAAEVEDFDDDGPMTWTRAIVRACGLLHTTPEVIGRMYVSAWRALCRGGKPTDVWQPVPFTAGKPLAPEVAEYLRLRREFWGREEAEVMTTPAPPPADDLHDVEPPPPAPADMPKHGEDHMEWWRKACERNVGGQTLAGVVGRFKAEQQGQGTNDTGGA